ncbi:FAD:protein FMN transferase [Paracoccus marinaquae]|uniref:FAD:protein FMN transferase n=1 Tax=Paracoccus marinaquae TaxID=2841926 RepID=A0ABS6AKE4_9RHOB|nr:FAD:protein FMN transferase [Paracoccus marinaquae]MBU3030582.1 FAD:protein FMN transferase [Paracoccus marinaquae]
MLTRRRFIAISAAMAATTRTALARPAARVWTGQAMGARASLRLDHPQAETIAARALAEIDRLEDILSLYRPDSALSRLNRDGDLPAPPFELLDCLALAGAVHRASEGAFDPSIQPLWTLWAEAAAAGDRPDPAAIRAARARSGWAGLRFDPARVSLRPGMALTLNGVGQGYVADRVALLLEAEGLTDILIDTGEFRALGGQPDGGDWPVRLQAGGSVDLRDRALATSAPRGTTFDSTGADGHIIDPATGRPVAAIWREVSVSAASAGLADALSTAACLTRDEAQMKRLIAGFAGARLEAAVRA